MKVAAICGHCRISFKKRDDHLRPINYCSRACFAKARERPGPWSETAKDQDAQREYHRAYRDKNRDKINALSRGWGKRNRKYRNYIQQLRRAVDRLPVKARKAIIAAAKKCAHCGTTEKLTIDHIVPLSRGGSADGKNIQVLCAPCNASKGNRDKPKLAQALYPHIEWRLS
jgi:5-methylcytosine-specific restriction endonuclease McrA